MAQEIEKKMKNLRTQLTLLVRSGEDEDGTILRRMLAELERLENQRALLRNRNAKPGVIRDSDTPRSVYFPTRPSPQ